MMPRSENLVLGINIGTTMARQVVAGGLSLFLSIFLARSLGTQGNGIYNLALLLPVLLGQLFNLGIGPANVYHIAKNEISLKGVVRITMNLWGILSVIGLGVGAILIFVFRVELFPDISHSILMIGLAIYPIILGQLLSVSILQGLQDFKHFNFVLILNPLLTLILAVVFISFLADQPILALVAFGASQLIVVILSWIHISQHFKWHSAPATLNRSDYKKTIAFGWKSHLANLMSFLNYRIDLLLLNILIDVSAAGVYIIAVNLLEKLWLLSQAVSTILYPKLASLHENEEKRRLLTLFITKVSFVLTFIGALLVALVASPAIRILYGMDFMGAVSALFLLLPGIIAGSVARILSNDISARGRPELNMYVGLASVIVNILANLILIPLFGINGAAVATSISYGLNAILKLIIYRRFSGARIFAPVLFGRQDMKRLVRIITEKL
ncbi:MAG: flippase [Lentisphaeria bacterium]|nr:flippase [Candidatus Neomarinimicrobiota bacterium]MCF7841347.1 flippase [Lentisphaeria bacterium]